MVYGAKRFHIRSNIHYHYTITVKASSCLRCSFPVVNKSLTTEDFFLLLRILKKKKKATPKSYLIICPSYYITDDGVLKLMYPSSLTHSPTFLPTLHPLSAIHTESPLQLPILHSLLNWTLVSWSLPLQIHLQNDKGATVKATFC